MFYNPGTPDEYYLLEGRPSTGVYLLFYHDWHGERRPGSQASSLVPYQIECKYDQVFTIGYNNPHHLPFFFFSLSFGKLDTFPISLFLFPTPVQIHQRPASWLSCSFNRASVGLGKTLSHPVTGMYFSNSVLIFITSYNSLLGGVLSFSFIESSWDAIVSSLLG